MKSHEISDEELAKLADEDAEYYEEIGYSELQAKHLEIARRLRERDSMIKKPTVDLGWIEEVNVRDDRTYKSYAIVVNMKAIRTGFFDEDKNEEFWREIVSALGIKKDIHATA